MSQTRVYVSATLRHLRELMASGGVGPAPFVAHAVTDRLRSEYPDGGDEEWEYSALSAAAQASLGVLTDEDLPRRVVVSVDVPGLVPVAGAEPTLVEVQEVVPANKVASAHVDAADAEADVRAAVAVWPAAEAGDADAQAVVERCLDHELGWFATQEIGELLENEIGS